VEASRVISRFLSHWGGSRRVKEGLVHILWGQVVGREIERRTRVRFVRDGVVHVDAETPVAADVFQTEAERIREKLNHALGEAVIREIRFSGRGFEAPARRRGSAAAASKGPREEELARLELTLEQEARIERVCSAISDPALRPLAAYVLNRVARLEAWYRQKRWRRCRLCGAYFPPLRRAGSAARGRGGEEAGGDLCAWCACNKRYR